MNQTGVETEDVDEITSCAACARHAAGAGCSPECERVQVSRNELAQILDVSLLWVWRAEKREIFSRAVTTGAGSRYVWMEVKAGVIKYFGPRWRVRLMAAEKRFREVLAGAVVRRPIDKKRTRVQKKAKGRK